MLSIQITSDINPVGLEKRFSEDITLKNLKDKLVLITGVESNNQTIELYIENKYNGQLDDNLQSLGNLLGKSNLERKLRLHVIDKLNSNKDFINEDSAKKYEMEDEVYDKRENSLRNFKKQNKLGRFKEE